MSAQLIIDPSRVTALACPFTFIIKTTEGKDTKFQPASFTVKNLNATYSQEYRQDTIKILAQLTAKQIRKEEEKQAFNYHEKTLIIRQISAQPLSGCYQCFSKIFVF